MVKAAGLHLGLFLILLGTCYSLVRFVGFSPRVLQLPVVVLIVGVGIDGMYRWHLDRRAQQEEAKKHDPIEPA